MMALLALIPVAIWLYLLVGRGMFWTMSERDDIFEGKVGNDPAPPAAWPSVTAVVPARNEADVIARSVGSLLAQDYPGDFRVVLVDDQSDDGTGDIARALGGKLTVLAGKPRPAGWTGKIWAMKQGTEAAGTPDYIWFTDADIDHAPENLRKLMCRAEAGNLVLTSLMVKLHCRSFSEAYLIPAFVFFFDMLYPFAWVNDPKNKTAAAAGGCMLARRGALERAGGVEVIRSEIIDDCAMGRAMKAQGSIWLGLTNRAISIRPYQGLPEIRRMVARSAYAQLGYSPLNLLGTFIGMIAVYGAAPALAIFAHQSAQASGILAWLAMGFAFQPILRFYRVSPLWGIVLPLIGFVYALFTLDSAIQHWRGKGGMWKGRAQAQVSLKKGQS
jgi:hopene-associated glycosyltransferase HpnB